VTGGPTVSDAAFWQGLYDQGSDRWELGRPNPSLGAHLARRPPPRGTVAVPGCGRGHDARLLARHGYQVFGFDFVPEVTRAARELAEREWADITFEDRDVFGLAETYPRFFDGVWEYTCFCAIDPARRAEYVEVLARILKPGGWLLACFSHGRRTGWTPVRRGRGRDPTAPRRALRARRSTSGYTWRTAAIALRGVAAIAPYVLLVPIVGGLFGLTWLGERVGPQSAAGAALTLVGLAQSRDWLPRRRR
jgi:methyl halide transferase